MTNQLPHSFEAIPGTTNIQTNQKTDMSSSFPFCYQDYFGGKIWEASICESHLQIKHLRMSIDKKTI